MSEGTQYDDLNRTTSSIWREAEVAMERMAWRLSTFKSYSAKIDALARGMIRTLEGFPDLESSSSPDEWIRKMDDFRYAMKNDHRMLLNLSTGMRDLVR